MDSSDSWAARRPGRSPGVLAKRRKRGWSERGGPLRPQVTESGVKNRAPLRPCRSLNLVVLSQAQGKLSRAKLSNQFPQVTQVTRPPGGGREGYSPCKATRQPASCHLRPGLRWLPLSSLEGGGGPGEACRVPWASRLSRPSRWAQLSAPSRRTGGPAPLPPLRSPERAPGLLGPAPLPGVCVPGGRRWAAPQRSLCMLHAPSRGFFPDSRQERGRGVRASELQGALRGQAGPENESCGVAFPCNVSPAGWGSEGPGPPGPPPGRAD